ncbi:MAG: VCBS repeat-containing protein [Gemmatimonadales bacterium]
MNDIRDQGVALVSLPMSRRWIVLALLSGCGIREKTATAPRFVQRPPSETGITFTNTVTTSDSLNPQIEIYVYNGAGVGVGDIDNDGLPDVFFAGNQVSSRLYRNTGNMRFEDITQAAGVTTTGWATGVSLVDVNADGFLDIYVCVSGPETSTPAQRANRLFVNNGNRTFTEAAARYGIADSGFSTHAAFLDYDRDGDLDLFLLNNSPREFARGALATQPSGIRTPLPENFNQLYRNNGNGTFTNVSAQAGILRTVGYGLGVAIADVNLDGWPDIYVSNDINPNDVLYVNQRDGTFRDHASAALKHTSYAGMGVDIADFNNDGRPDILQADMMPHALAARQRMSGFLNYGNLVEWRQNGLRVDYDLNALQLNNGVADSVVFSEIGRMAGIAYTDWSWSALFADLDNDGFKDIVITNGYPKAVNDLDYQIGVYAARRAGHHRRALDLLRDLHSYDVPNYLFRNNGDFTFDDSSAAWGMERSGFSYGAAYADLNNDGRLDLVVNNLDAPAAVYENVGTTAGHYLRIALQGTAPNVRGIGALVTVVAGGQRQFLYQSPYRGYMSTVDDRLHVGLGAATRVDTVTVSWPDGRVQVVTNLPADRQVVLDQKRATRPAKPAVTRTLRFARMRPPRYAQPQSNAVDFAIQPLLPDQPSAQGPALAVGDVNGDGLDDVFVGGTVFLQTARGGFVESWHDEGRYEDWGAAFLDANGDGRLDLYVASGGYQLAPASRLLQDRLYLNRGKGRFARDSAALPIMLTSTATVAVGDFNGDGRPDLFVGGRLVPRNYPYPARSYLLRNDGTRFTDVTDSVAPELARPVGMVTDAVWTDFDGDGRPDLVTAGQWMPLRFFKNDGARLRDVTAARGLPPLRGWWYRLAAGDFNGDGHIDLIAGNLGLNHSYSASRAAPLGVYASNFTGNQVTDIVLTTRLGGRDYPLAGRATLGQSIYTVGLRFPTYAAYSEADVSRVLGAEQLPRALHYEVDTLASLYLQNRGDGTFATAALPNLAQISAVRGIVVHDVDGDGNLDLIVAGNLFDTEPNTPRADAGNGLWLKGDGHGHFAAVPPAQSGFLAPRDVTGLVLVKTPTGSAVLVANHGDSLSAFSVLPR